jgi:hypothetical protein
MATPLRRAYDDELLCSVVREYAHFEQVSSTAALLRRAFGYETISLMLPGGLRKLQEETQCYWNLNDVKIAQSMTPLPYYAAASSPKISDAVLAGMCDTSGEIYNRGGLGFGRFKELRYFRMCGQCAAKDFRYGRIPYIRRAHQLPGVVYCHLHGELLRESRCSANVSMNKFLASGWDWASGGVLPFQNLATERIGLLKAVARYSSFILNQSAPAALFGSRGRYLEALNALGYVVKSGKVRLHRLSGDIVDAYGTEYLQWVGLYRSGQEARDWLVPMLCEGQAVPPTVAHVLLREFLGARSAGLKFQPVAEMLRCPSLFCGLPVETYNGITNRVQTEIVEGRCQCGTRFKGTTQEGRSGSSVRIYRYGCAYGAEAIQLAAAGNSVAKIAARLKVSGQTVRRLVSRTDALSRGQTADVAELRAQWLRALSGANDEATKTARISSRKTYRMLLKYDRDWLKEHSAENLNGRCRVDWPARDRLLLPELSAAAETLAQESPPRWVSAISILLLAKAPLGTKNQLVKLPLCTAYLSSAVESRADFRRRCMAFKGHIADG